MHMTRVVCHYVQLLSCHLGSPNAPEISDYRMSIIFGLVFIFSWNVARFMTKVTLLAG